MTDTQQQFLDEMTNEERSVFLYYFVFKIPQKEIAKHLHFSPKFIKEIVNYQTLKISFLPTLEDILDLFYLVNP